MVVELERFWSKLFVGDGFSCTCNGYMNLFAILELVYRELSIEFFATINFEDKTTDPNYNQTLAFHLGGVYCECSLMEFTWRMGLYTEEETQSPYFVLFLQGCVRDFTSGVIMSSFGKRFLITGIVLMMQVKD